MASGVRVGSAENSRAKVEAMYPTPANRIRGMWLQPKERTVETSEVFLACTRVSMSFRMTTTVQARIRAWAAAGTVHSWSFVRWKATRLRTQPETVRGPMRSRPYGHHTGKSSLNMASAPSASARVNSDRTSTKPANTRAPKVVPFTMELTRGKSSRFVMGVSLTMGNFNSLQSFNFDGLLLLLLLLLPKKS